MQDLHGLFPDLPEVCSDTLGELLFLLLALTPFFLPRAHRSRESISLGPWHRLPPPFLLLRDVKVGNPPSVDLQHAEGRDVDQLLLED